MKPGAKISVLLVLPLGGEAKQASDEAGLDFLVLVFGCICRSNVPASVGSSGR